MSLKPTIYLLVEIKARELEAKLLLALEAARRGYRVIIGNQDHLKKLIKKELLPPGVFFYKNLSPGKEKDLSFIHSQGYHIVSQDEESGLLDFSYEKFISFRSCKDTVDLTSQVYCWGEHDQKSWVDHYPEKEQNIFATGSPRVDYWREDFLPYYEGSVKEIKSRYGDFVLIPSNFPLGNGYMTLDQRIQQGRVNGSIKTSEDEQALIESVEDTKKMFHLFVDLVKYLAASDPDINYVVRPHPVERLSEWKSRLDELPNVDVVFEGSVSKWVRACRVVLHNGCTTGIEARFSGVPAIAYTPFESPINREVPNAASLECSSPEKVAFSIRSVIKEGDKYLIGELGVSILNNRFSNFQGKPAYQRIISEIEKIKVPLSPSPEKNLMTMKYIKRYELNRYFKKLRGKDDHGIRKFPGVKKEELEDIKRKLCRVRPELSIGGIRHYIGDIYIVES